MQSPRVRNRNRCSGHFLRDHAVDEESAVLLDQDNIAGGDLAAILALDPEDIMRPERGSMAGPNHLQMKVVPLAQIPAMRRRFSGP